MKQFLVDTIHAAGKLLQDRFGKAQDIRRKENVSSIVTEVDLASEELILKRIREFYKEHNIVAEESGFDDRGSDWTWVVDPLDGTSNYAAGIPWYGVMLALLHKNTPVLGGMYLPQEQTLYLAESGHGTTRNGLPVQVSSATHLDQVLIAYAADATRDRVTSQRQALGFAELLHHVRNLRATNCLVDFTLTIDGRLGGFINHSTRIWDIAAAAIILHEAGGRMTHLDGTTIDLTINPAVCERSYSVMGANPLLLAQLNQLWRSVSSTPDPTPMPPVAIGS